MVPYRTIDVNAPLASAFVNRGLNVVSGMISLGAVAGLTSVLLVLLLGQSRIFFAMSRDGLLPPAFCRVHPRFRTPYIPTIMTGIAVGIAAALLPIEEIAELTNIGTLFAFSCWCAWGFGFCATPTPTASVPFRTPLVPLVPILGVVFCGYLMARLPERDLDSLFRLARHWSHHLFHLRPLSQPRQRVRKWRRAGWRKLRGRGALVSRSAARTTLTYTPGGV